MSAIPLDDAPVAGSASAVEAWHSAWADTMHFVGDPFATLAEANANDDSFAMGSLFCASYRLLGGVPPDDPAVQLDMERAAARASSPRDRVHLEAVTSLRDGEVIEAALRWDDIAADTVDFAAVRLAHDAYLHVGEVDHRVASGERARDQFSGRGAASFVAGQHAFSMEEAGHYDEAEQLGWQGLEADPLDLWALHALAHVYESTDDQEAAISLLEGRAPTWTAQEGLAVHVHWHHALRLIAGGFTDEALALFDRLVPDAGTPFRISDLSSLLWRLELVGVDVGDRWQLVADRYAPRPERHTVGFLDLHMAFAFTRVPDHPEAASFFNGVAPSHADDPSENGITFREVVVPLVEAIRRSPSEPTAAVELLDSVADRTHRIGGSIAQRDVLAITRAALAQDEQDTT